MMYHYHLFLLILLASLFFAWKTTTIDVSVIGPILSKNGEDNDGNRTIWDEETTVEDTKRLAKIFSYVDERISSSSAISSPKSSMLLPEAKKNFGLDDEAGGKKEKLKSTRLGRGYSFLLSLLDSKSRVNDPSQPSHVSKELVINAITVDDPPFKTELPEEKESESVKSLSASLLERMLGKWICKKCYKKKKKRKKKHSGYGSSSYGSHHKSGYGSSSYGRPHKSGYGSSSFGHHKNSGYSSSSYGSHHKSGYGSSSYGSPPKSGYGSSSYSSPHKSGYGSSSFGHHKKNSGYGSSSFGHHKKNSGYGSSSFDHHKKNSGYGNSSFGHHKKNSGYGSSSFGHHKNSGYGSNSYGTSHKNSGYSSSPYGIQNNSGYSSSNKKRTRRRRRRRKKKKKKKKTDRKKYWRRQMQKKEIFDEKEIPTIAEITSTTNELSTFAMVLKKTGLYDDLNKDGTVDIVTVFAPTNKAFDSLKPGMFDKLLANPERLRDVLLYHIVPDDIIYSHDLEKGQHLPTLQNHGGGSSIMVTSTNPIALNGSARLVFANAEAKNGIVHVINEFHAPKSYL